MDDNIASFMTKARSDRGSRARVIGNYTLAIFDFHIAILCTQRRNFTTLTKKRKTKVVPIGFSINRGSFSKRRAFQSKNASTLPRGVNSELFTPERKSEAV
jgi:hypothetical protein